MSLRSTQRKRKYHREYHDPDYERSHPMPEKRHRDVSTKKALICANSQAAQNKEISRISELASQAFTKEIEIKHNQLEEIEHRLMKASSLLERLRFSIISEYYRKQELSLNSADAAAIREKNTLFDGESMGPQMAIHPSIKKIIGKKPNSCANISGRSLPERVAAQNALSTIRARSQIYRRQERRIQRIIQGQSLIDPTKNTGNKGKSKERSVIIEEVKNSEELERKQGQEQLEKCNVLNAPRLNNMIKQIIVIGNTSKYIGRNCNMEQEQRVYYRNMLSHKWLVYVQSKDDALPLEYYVKKVRFQLHPSYRPNDIIDVSAPPFQLARCGWGEFPVRIQIFFQENLQQKPIQLIHNLVLDRTLSGIHTMGAETLMEVWLRSGFTNELNITASKVVNVESAKTKPHSISFAQNKEEDDNLLCFLNKIDQAPPSICADIEKIQPTLVVPESIVNIPIKNPIDNQINILRQEAAVTKLENNKFGPPITAFAQHNSGSITPYKTTKGQSEKQQTRQNSTLGQSKLGQFCDINRYTSMQLTAPIMVRLPKPLTAAASCNKMSQNRLGKLIPLKTTSTTATVTKASTTPTSFGALNDTAIKNILQKKIVQVIDSEGKCKYMHMLVATTPTIKSLATSSKISPREMITGELNVTNSPSDVRKNIAANFLKPNIDLSQSAVKSIAVSNSTNSPMAVNQSLTIKAAACRATAANVVDSKVNSSPKQIVFQKEGKLYIIDPLQIRLKQQQKKQVSLLKPQVSLLRQNQPCVPQSVPYDHDYTPTRISAPKFSNPQSMLPYTHPYNPSNSGPVTILKSIQAQQQFTLPPLHLGIRQTRAKVNNAFELLQLRRIQFEQDFLRRRFISISTAIEYLLHRLPLVAAKHSLAAAFSFARYTEKEFNELHVLKQRACEWLRAKYVIRFLNKHKDLLKLSNAEEKRMWSTREVVIYARHHAYASSIKTLEHTTFIKQRELMKVSNKTKVQSFCRMIKKEVQSEPFKYNTLTMNNCIQMWLDNVLGSSTNCGNNIEYDPLIDVVNIENQEENVDYIARSDDISLQLNTASNMQLLYLPTPEHLEQSSQLVNDFCRDIGIHLQAEEISAGILQPAAQIMLAQCLNLFMEKLLRRAVASKWQSESQTNVLNITLQDIGRVITQHVPFDYLTNSYFGASRCENVE